MPSSHQFSQKAGALTPKFWRDAHFSGMQIIAYSPALGQNRPMQVRHGLKRPSAGMALFTDGTKVYKEDRRAAQLKHADLRKFVDDRFVKAK
ncbi:MAG: hypothetical protein ACREQ2_14030 [Candidatus Binatia bacterium]